MKYRVMLRGENFELDWEGQVKIFGFVTTRWVKAKDTEEAELKAVALIQNDTKLTELIIDESKLTAKIYLEEISKDPWWKRVGGGGYTFYEMK